MTVYKGIDINAMYQKALTFHNVTRTYTDLMTEDKVKIWRGLHEVYQSLIRSLFVLLLINNDMDRQIVPSIYLTDDIIQLQCYIFVIKNID